MKKIIVLLLILSSEIFSQKYFFHKSFNQTLLFPETKLFPSNFSDPFEAKIGSQFYLDDKNLELNIGASKDLIHYYIDNRGIYSNTLGVGVEFFNWTLLNRKNQFRFPVVAADYFFGTYFIFYHRWKNLNWFNRLRISHISAHLSDGAFDKNQNQWNNNQLPFTYSREFFQWTSAFIYGNMKLYFDAIYIFHSIPEMKFNFITGIGSEVILIGFPELRTKIFSGFDLKFHKVLGNNFDVKKSFSVGFILGNENVTHLRLAYQYYNGSHIHGQFFNSKLNQSFINISLVI